MVLDLVLVEPAKTILTQIGHFLSGLVLVVLILIIGWLVARLIKAVVVRILKIVRLDEILDRIKVNQFLAKGGVKYSFSELIGVVCYWLTLLIAFVVAVNTVAPNVASDLLNRIMLYIPNIFVAVFILILGMFVATFLNTIVQTIASNAGIAQSKVLGKITAVVVVIFSVIIALEQLNIAITTLSFALNIILASLGLGLALAFGLGCRDIAGKIMSDWVDRLKSKK